MIKSWSFSRYALYEQCPLKFKLLVIDKVMEPQSPALVNGLRVHRLAEDFLNKEISELPEELNKFEDDFHKFRDLPDKKVENTLAFTKDWMLTNWSDWNNCYLRVKIDFCYFDGDNHVTIIDWKTGKFRESDIDKYTEQLELYALSAFMRYPSIETVDTKLYYLDLGIIHPDEENKKVFTRENKEKLLNRWQERIEPMFTDTQFKPRLNKYCKYCHHRKSNGGSCTLDI